MEAVTVRCLATFRRKIHFSLKWQSDGPWRGAGKGVKKFEAEVREAVRMEGSDSGAEDG